MCLISSTFFSSCFAKQERKQSSLGLCDGLCLEEVPFIGWTLKEERA